jgi:hypothetical protein
VSDFAVKHISDAEFAALLDKWQGTKGSGGRTQTPSLEKPPAVEPPPSAYEYIGPGAAAEDEAQTPPAAGPAAPPPAAVQVHELIGHATTSLAEVNARGEEYAPLKFDNAADFAMFFTEDFDLAPWQIEELLRLSGFSSPGRSTERLKPTAEEPMLYNLVATNGSGKDAVVLAWFILWMIACKIRSTVIATSNTEQQIKAQTYKHCQNYAARINLRLGREIISYKDQFLKGELTDSECRMFVTNEAGRAEGFHANPGREFAFIVNEAKSIDDELFGGFSRYTGWNYWIEVSSAGERAGHFYRRCSAAGAVHYPDPLKLKEHYVRKIRVKDCPWILKNDVRLKEIERDFGKDSPVYKSVMESEFSSDSSPDILIRSSATIFEDPIAADYGMPRYAGVDLSLGGDETVVSIWQGNRRIGQEVFRERYEPTLHARLMAVFQTYNLIGENIAVDAGGLGKPIVHRLIESGWNVQAFNFGGAAQNKKYFLNRGAELWQRLKRLVEERLIVLPRSDEKFMDQMTSRRFTYANGKMKLESKQDVISRGEPSPDRVDAAVMAWSLVDFDVFLAAAGARPEAPAPDEYDLSTYRTPKRPAPRELSFEEAMSLIEQRRHNNDTRFRGEAASVTNKGRIGGMLCKILNVRLR